MEYINFYNQNLGHSWDLLQIHMMVVLLLQSTLVLGRDNARQEYHILLLEFESYHSSSYRNTLSIGGTLNKKWFSEYQYSRSRSDTVIIEFNYDQYKLYCIMVHCFILF